MVMKYIVLNIDKIGIDFSNGMPHEFEHALVNAGCLGHVPLDMPEMVSNSKVMVVRNCDTNLLDIVPDAIVYQTDSDEDWQVWLDANTVQVTE